MAIKKAQASSLTKGSFIVIDGVACKVTDVQKSKPGKHGSAKARIIASGYFDGRNREMVCSSQDDVDVPIIEKRNAQILSVSGDMANVMDSENFDTFDLKIAEELKDDIAEGITIVYWEILGEKFMKQVKNG